MKGDDEMNECKSVWALIRIGCLFRGVGVVMVKVW